MLLYTSFSVSLQYVYSSDNIFPSVKKKVSTFFSFFESFESNFDGLDMICSVVTLSFIPGCSSHQDHEPASENTTAFSDSAVGEGLREAAVWV